MKSIQKFIALGLMVFLSINIATAQRGNNNVTPEVRAQKQTERLTKQLSLTESQTTQVAAISLEYANKMTAAKASTTDKEASRAASKTLRTEQATAIKAVLTPEQLTMYNEKGNRKRGGKKGKGKVAKSAKQDRGEKTGTPEERATKQTERLTKQLELTEDQATKITAINLSYAEKKATAKAATTDKEASKAANKTLKAEQAEAIKAVLTPEQLTKYNEKGARKKGRKKGGKKAQF